MADLILARWQAWIAQRCAMIAAWFAVQADMAAIKVSVWADQHEHEADERLEDLEDAATLVADAEVDKARVKANKAVQASLAALAEHQHALEGRDLRIYELMGQH